MPKTYHRVTTPATCAPPTQTLLPELVRPILFMTSAGILSGFVASYALGIGLYGAKTVVKDILRLQ